MSDWKQTIADAKELLDMGAITQEQFEQIRDDALASRTQGTTTPPTAKASSTEDANRDVTEGMTEPPPGLEDVGTIVGKLGGEAIGNYIIQERLGEGGMGVVYRARHQNEQFAEGIGDIAIKMIRPSFANDPDFRTRFIREAILGKRFTHPNIAKVIDVYEDEDVLALLMDYIEGPHVNEIIPEAGMPVDDVVKLLMPIAEALEYLHEQGIVHRDMKPANVRVKPDGTPVILDFGIAKDLNDVDTGMTQTGTALGTHTYMAPEQMDAKNATGASDQYALAMMAYQMLSGRLPWGEGLSSPRITTSKMTGDLLDLHQVMDVSDELNETIMKGLSLNPVERFENCIDFVKAFHVEIDEDCSDQAGQVESIDSPEDSSNSVPDISEDFTEDTQTEEEPPVPIEPSPIETATENDASTGQPEAISHSDTIETTQQPETTHQEDAEVESTDETEQAQLMQTDVEDKDKAETGDPTPVVKEESSTEEAAKDGQSQFRVLTGVLFALLSASAVLYHNQTKQEALEARFNAMYPTLKFYEISVSDTHLTEEGIAWLQSEIDFQEGLEARIVALESDRAKYALERPAAGRLTVDEVEKFEKEVRSRLDEVKTVQEMYEVALIPAGQFLMGCTEEQGSDCDSDEKPKRSVKLTRDFYMMKHEVTQELYRKFYPKHKSTYKGDKRPVENVNWYDALSFANALSRLEGREECYSSGDSPGFNHDSWKNQECTGWRLPTDAEWEYAARGGDKYDYKYAGSNDVQKVAWYGYNHDADLKRTATVKMTTTVCTMPKTNRFGLCDMSGNVMEIVWDYYDIHRGHSEKSATVDPRGPTSGSYIVYRGGSYYNGRNDARVSAKWRNYPSKSFNNLGFRLVRQVYSPKPPPDTAVIND